MTEDFEALEREWAQAIADRDVEAAERLLADDFYLSSAIWRDREIGQARWKGEDISDDYVVTDVWRREQDGWRVVWRASAGAPGRRRLPT